MRWKHRNIPGFIIALLAALAALLIPSVVAGDAPVSGALLISGQTVPLETVEVPSVIRGQLVALYVKEGQTIRKGDPIAQLDDQIQKDAVALARAEAESTIEIRAAESQVAFQRNQMERLQGIGASASQSELRAQELQVKQAELFLEQKVEAQAKHKIDLDRELAVLDHMTIRSPLEGSVLRLNKRVGEQVDVDKPLAVIVQTAKLNARFYPPKTLFGKIKAGDKVTIELKTEPSCTREAVVVSVDPVVDASQLFGVKLELDNADQSIPAGVPAIWNWNPRP